MSDVFVSYNRKDVGEVELLVHRLRATGVDVWLDTTHHEAGEDWLPELERAMVKAATMLVCIGRHNIGPVQSEEVQLALKLAVYDSGGRRLIPIILPTAGDSPEMPELLKLKGWIDLRTSNDSGEFRALLNAIARRPPGVPTVAAGKSPYMGLRSFEESNAEHFFGRERDVHDLLTALRRGQRLLTLVGASGSGKSSLLAAGLVPAIRAGELDGTDDWLIITIRPGQRPCRSLAVELVRQQAEAPGQRASLSDDIEEVEKLRAAMLKRPETVVDAMTLIGPAQRSPKSILLVVDQLEELFTQTRDPQETVAFVANVDYATRASDVRVFAVQAVRADFLHKCMVLPRDLAEHLVKNLAYCLAMDRPQLREAILRPAVQAHLTLEEGLADALLDEVYGRSGDLPLLQFTLEQLWHARTKNVLTWDAYERMGKVRGALEKKAEAVFAGLSSEEQLAARRLLSRMVVPGSGTGDTRRRAPRGELEQISGGDKSPILELLIRERLLTAHEDGLEVAHETLISNWKRFRRWIDEDREGIRVRHSLTEAANEWQKRGRDQGYLFRGAKLGQTSVWVEQHESDLSPLELEFYRESLQQQQAEQRLSDAAVIDQLEAAAPDVWPDAAAMAEWLDRAREVTRGLAAHRQHADRLAAALRSNTGDPLQQKKRVQTQATVASLLVRMEQFASGLLASAEHVAQVANDRRNGREPDLSRWSQAIASIADIGECPAYGGLKLAPQQDLVPLWRNAATGLWEFVHLPSGTPPKTADGQITIDGTTGVVLILLPGGRFWMGAARDGATNTDPLARPDEAPCHPVALDPFFIAKHEFTQGQWLRLTGRNPSYFFAGRKDTPFTLENPVDSVDWTTARETVRRAGLDLPTEAQWEYASRAGTTTPWFTGPDPAAVYAAANLLENGAPHHLAVGSFAPNQFGLHDTAGNVWEWCRDANAAPYTAVVHPGDGLRDGADDGMRVFRGGAFLSSPERARCAYRYIVRGDYLGSYVGLRAARRID